jgi:hypothetical protein
MPRVLVGVPVQWYGQTVEHAGEAVGLTSATGMNQESLAVGKRSCGDEGRAVAAQPVGADTAAGMLPV